MTAILDRLRPTGLHRAVDEVERLTEKVRRLETQLRQVTAEKRAAMDTADNLRVRACGAETVAACLDQQLEEATARNEQLDSEATVLRARLGPYLAADANQNAITVPASVRDTRDVADQATEPINVLPLWDALGGIAPSSALRTGPTPATPAPPPGCPPRTPRPHSPCASSPHSSPAGR